MENVRLNLTKLKEKYNKLIARNKKAEEYFDKAQAKDVIHYLPEFNSITIQLSHIIREYEALSGTEMTDKEVLEGFCP